MHVTQFSLRNFKGTTATYRATPRTFITGKNRSGKSSLVQACQLALSGRLPDLGVKEIFKLSSGSAMMTEVLFGAAGISREWKQDQKGSISCDVNVIGDLSPDDVQDVPLLNAHAYFQMTETERIAYVLRYAELPPDISSTSGLIARLQRLGFGDEHSEEIENAKADMIRRISEELAEHGTVSEGVIATVKDGGLLKTEFTARNRKQKDTAGAVRVITDLKLREAECSAETVGEIEEEIARLSQEQRTLQDRIAAEQSQQAQRQRTAKRREELDRLLAAPPVDHTSEKALFEKTRQEALATLKALSLPTDRKTDDALQAAAEKATADYFAVDGAAKRAVQARQQATSDLAALDKLACCPHCGGKAKGWDKKLRESITTRLDEAKAEAEKNAVLAKAAHTKSQEASAASTKRREQRSQEFVTQRKLDESIAAIREIERADEDLARRCLAAREELAAMGDAPAENQASLQETAQLAVADVKRLDGEIAILRGKRDAALKLRQDIQRAAQAEIEHLKEKAYVTVIKAIGAELAQVQREMIEKAFGKLIEDANRLTEGLMPKLEFHEGVVGYFAESGRFVTHSTFSGLEKTIGYLGIAAALSASSIYRGLILDEFHNLTPEMQKNALGAIDKAIDGGLLDQAFIVAPSDEPNPAARGCPAGWQHIAL